MSQVTSLALRKLWNSWNRSYIPMKMGFLCQYCPSNSPPTSHSLPHSSHGPYNLCIRCSHLLQHKLPRNNHCQTQNNNQVPTLEKTTANKIVNSQSDGCFLKVLWASASTWHTKSWTQQMEATFEMCKKSWCSFPLTYVHQSGME